MLHLAVWTEVRTKLGKYWEVIPQGCREIPRLQYQHLGWMFDSTLLLAWPLSHIVNSGQGKSKENSRGECEEAYYD